MCTCRQTCNEPAQLELSVRVTACVAAGNSCRHRAGSIEASHLGPQSAQMGNEPEPTGGDEAAAEGAEIAMTTLPQLVVTDVIKSQPKIEPDAP